MTAVKAIAHGAEYPMLVDMAATQSPCPHWCSIFMMACAGTRIALLGSGPVNRIRRRYVHRIEQRLDVYKWG